MTTPEHTPTPDLSDPAQISRARQTIENEAEQMRHQGIGAPDYFGLMNLHPESQRVFFIHIPKCGGTSVRKTLVHSNKCAPIPLSGSGPIDQAIAYMAHCYPPKTPQGELLRSYLAEDAAMDRQQRFLRVYAGYQLIQNPERMFILGHKQARELLPYYRAGKDIFFTTVRDPAEMLKSMVAYRVSHTLKNDKRPDSVNLLKYLRMDIDTFTEAVRSQPQALAEKILKKEAPCMAAFLSFDSKPNHSAVMKSLKTNNVFIAHMSEQNQMLTALFGEQTVQPRENSSHTRQGLAAEFTAMVPMAWTSPFVDAQSQKIYNQLEASGIIGYWEKGGTKAGYLELLRNL
ncbi:Uncharacterised protein [Halioglobus japonicus]|nr:Uncharacterised protein [Halioglobus japonicus]